jgi:hypothetical protein
VAAKIKTLRDKHHAHLEMRKLDEEPGAFDINTLGLTFNEVLALAIAVRPSWQSWGCC